MMTLEQKVPKGPPAMVMAPERPDTLDKVIDKKGSYNLFDYMRSKGRDTVNLFRPGTKEGIVKYLSKDRAFKKYVGAENREQMYNMLERVVSETYERYGGMVNSFFSKLTDYTDKPLTAMQLAADGLFVFTGAGAPGKLLAWAGRTVKDLLYMPYYLYQTAAKKAYYSLKEGKVWDAAKGVFTGAYDLAKWAGKKLFGLLIPGGTLADLRGVRGMAKTRLIDEARSRFLRELKKYKPLGEVVKQGDPKKLEYILSHPQTAA